ncbi:MAG: aminodeoxychorismate/anthranilate synthase component II [Bacteroidota bacterium]|nr:aminodeoxychorismate/anthranilate synthase component II [Bacteroidota bacterium]
MKILILDNYDSFTYNLLGLIRNEENFEIDVIRNDEITIAEVAAYDQIILSPGPGLPADAGLMCELILQYQHSKPIFGVCLGMQAIGEVFGGRLINLEEPQHGVATEIHHTKSKLFSSIPSPFAAGRYHSWAVEKNSLPSALLITALDDAGVVMAIEHKTLPIAGVQFHPESILTEYGKKILINFLMIHNEV